MLALNWTKMKRILVRILHVLGITGVVIYFGAGIIALIAGFLAFWVALFISLFEGC